VIALTDLMIAAGTLDELLDAINDLSVQPDRKDTQERLARLSYGACRLLLLESPGTPIDLRLPNLGSPRAQRMIGTWASLAPRLFLPLGMKGFYVPLLQGIADAARDTGHTQIVPLAAAINSVEELQVFRRDAASVGLQRAGAVLQSTAGLANAITLVGADAALWVDIREILRTFNGYPSALSFGDEAFQGYVEEGLQHDNSRTCLGPHLRNMLGALIVAAGTNTDMRLGVECSDGTALPLIKECYQLGARIFSVPAAASAGTRLALGQLVEKGVNHD
jgi:pyruvate, orthophosphate dikinase